MGNLTDKLSRYFWFSLKEIKYMLITVFVMGLVFSFNNWGYIVDGKPIIDASYGLRNLVNGILLAALTLFVHHSVQRIIAINVGFKPEHTLWKTGILVALVVAVISNGVVPFLALSGLMLYHLTGHRLGEYRYGLTLWQKGYIGMAGPVSVMFLAVIFKFMGGTISGDTLVDQAFVFNLWFAGCSLLPIPPIDGSHMFFGNRFMYVLSAAAGLAFILLITTLSVFLSLVLAIILAVAAFVLYYLAFAE